MSEPYPGKHTRDCRYWNGMDRTCTCGAGPDEPSPSPDEHYRAGLVEGFRRGTQAAIAIVEDTRCGRRLDIDADYVEERIRALRPEGEKT